METDDNNKTNVKEEGEPTCPIPGFSSINEFSQNTLKAVLQATKSSNDLPVGDDFDFYSTYSSVRDVLDIEGKRILTLIQRILRHQNVKGNVGASASLDLEDRFDVLMDSNDQILERAGTLLDEASGVRKQEAKLVLASTAKPRVSTSWNKKFVSPSGAAKPSSAYRLLTARNIQRPQVRFKDKIDNTNCPFKPLLKEKPNALKPLDESLKIPESVTMEELEMPEFVHPHPYGYELEMFTPDAQLMSKVKPQEPQPVSLTPLVFVDKADQLANLLDDLKQQKVIAVDLEHHSYRSFQGITCLMQISTRCRDYLVDTLELREELRSLNEVFTDPKITKVFHGADSDMMWLQRDFGVYVVNMFDTGQAARILNLPRFSLAHLLMQYCRVEADKQFQLADWRIRPLPNELVNYAREDTHYLLYIYDLMRNQLLDQGNQQANLLTSVYTRSKQVASSVYRKPTFKESDHMELYRKSRKTFHNQQMAALQDLFRWRDLMARQEDESLGYVLPNHMLLQIAEILPREHQGVLACCNPIPPLVRQNLPEIHKMVLQARELTLAKIEKSTASQPAISQHPKYDSDSLLHCRHDMSRQEDYIAEAERDIAETGLIASVFPVIPTGGDLKGLPVVDKDPVISAFATCQPSQIKSNRTKLLAEKIRSLFPSPFVKFLKGKSDVIKPSHQEIWNLKCSTNKRKAETKDKIDLDSFVPEYAPPSKRAKVTVNLTTSKSKSIFGVPEADSQTTSNKDAAEVRQKISSKLQSLREEVSKVKQRLKQVEEKRAPEEKSSNSNSTNEGGSATDGKPPKKKKKKQKKEENEEEAEFEGFDYEAAEAQLKKEASNAKKPDIYNPRLPNKDKKKKGNKGDKKGKSKPKKTTDS